MQEDNPQSRRGSAYSRVKVDISIVNNPTEVSNYPIEEIEEEKESGDTRDISQSNINIDPISDISGVESDRKNIFQSQTKPRSKTIQIRSGNKRILSEPEETQEDNEVTDFDPEATAKKLVPKKKTLKDELLALELVEVQMSTDHADQVPPEPAIQPLQVDRAKKVIGSPCLRGFHLLIRILGSLIMLANLISEIVYLFKNKFATLTFFSCYVTVCALKILIPFILVLINLKTKVFGKFPKEYTYEMENQQREKLKGIFRCSGLQLYTAVPLMYWTGVFRFLNTKNFAKEIGIGFGLDIFFVVALVLLQGVNNATLTASPLTNQLIAQGSFRQISILLKFSALLIIIVELIIFIYEVCRLHQLKKKNIDVLVRFSEEKKRKFFANKYLRLSTISSIVAVALCIALCQILPAKECPEKQGLLFTTVCTDCQIQDCLNCAQSGPYSCDQCKVGTLYNPVKKTCQDCDGQQNATVCLKCYQSNLTIEMTPKCLECGSGYRLGKVGTTSEGQCLKCSSNCDICENNFNLCTKCNAGYYQDKQNTTCTPCNNRCLECKNSTACTKCKSDIWELDSAKMCQCKTGYQLDINKQSCQSCRSIDSNCNICQNGNCTRCNSGFYVEKGICKPCVGLCTECTSPYYCTKCQPDLAYLDKNNKCLCKTGLQLDVKLQSCVPCSQIDFNCISCDGGRCNKCNTGFYVDAGDCTPCGGMCIECQTRDTCTKCRSEGWYLDNKNQCKCRTGYYLDVTKWVCASCTTLNANCNSCDQGKCTKCNPGFYVDNGRCSPCVGLCSECSNAVTCTKCRSDVSILDSAKKCQCLTGYQLDNTKLRCLSCSFLDTNCNSCENNKCTKCNTGFYMDINGLCMPCVGLCVECSSANSCTKCRSDNSYLDTAKKQCQCLTGYQLDMTGLSCKSCNVIDINCNSCINNSCTRCNTGFYLDNGLCTPCVGLCVECSNATSCTKCRSDNSYLDSAKKCQCLTGYQLQNFGMSCLSCNLLDQNCNSCAGDNCTKCNTGFFVDKGRCTPCAGLCVECSSATSCTKCRSDNSYLDSAKKCQCLNGYQLDNLGLSCLPCNILDQNCNSCVSGNCTKCNSGYYLENGKCKPCVGLCVECSNSNDCTKCRSDNSYLDGNKKCQCLNGYNLDKSGLSCLPCSQIANNCISCASGYCTKCNTGTYLSNGLCEPCVGLCVECSSSTACSQCRSDVSFLDANKKCQCLVGFQLSSNGLSCSSCSLINSNCISCGNGICTACKTGYYLDGNLCIITRLSEKFVWTGPLSSVQNQDYPDANKLSYSNEIVGIRWAVGSWCDFQFITKDKFQSNFNWSYHGTLPWADYYIPAGKVVSKVSMRYDKYNGALWGIKFWNSDGSLIFSTGYEPYWLSAEDTYLNTLNITLQQGEKLIGIKSSDAGQLFYAHHFNFQWIIGRLQ